RQARDLGSPVPQEQSVLRLQLADALLEQEQVDEAERLYREELRLRPSNPRACLGLGIIALARGDEPGAARFLEAARSSPHARRKATAQLAVLARARGEEGEAAGYEKEAAGMSPDPDWPDPFMQAVFEKRVGRAAAMQDVAQLEREGRYQEAADEHLR